MTKEEIEKDKAYWVGFNVFAGVGPGIFGRLLKVFGTAEAAWGAEGSELAPILGGKVWERFGEFRRKHEPVKYLKSLRKLTSPDVRRGIRVLILPEEGYPELLREIEDPPPVLYCLGDAGILNNPQIAVVGARKMTDYGARVARELVRDLVYSGFTITSGLAYGIDTVAHRTALDQGGKTVAVLGCGVDICYPREHIKIYERIIGGAPSASRRGWTEPVETEFFSRTNSPDVRRAQTAVSVPGGVVISELPPSTKTHRGIFVARNRIISGLSLGVLVVEGAKRSGTLITAGYAAKQGREVFAVPGPITSIYSDGPNLLIKEGAKAVKGAEDIIEEFKTIGEIFNRGRDRGKDKGKIGGLSEEEKGVVEVLVRGGEEGVHIDRIIRELKLESGEVAGVLSQLEVKGIIRDIGGGRYGLSS